MNLKSGSSSFQNIIFVALLWVYIFACGVVWDFINVSTLIESEDWILIAIYAGIMIVIALLISCFLQFIFGLPWLGTDPSKACAHKFQRLSMYQPSRATVYASVTGQEYYVELHLVLSVADFITFLMTDSSRRSGLNYFLLFEGDFPFARDRQKLYLTRAALRRVRQYSHQVFTADNACGYVQFDFDFKLPYYGREASLLDRYYLLSRWDIRRIERILGNSDLGMYSFLSSTGDLTLKLEDLAIYRKWLERTPRDTFVAAIPNYEAEEEEEQEEQEGKSNE